MSSGSRPRRASTRWSTRSPTCRSLPEAADAVRRIHAADVRTGILTNASSATLGRVVARLDLPIDHALSVDAARTFKPHPRVYQLAVDATGLLAERIGFVTANGWDAAGAGAVGLRVAWLRPDPTAVLPAVGAPEPVIAAWPDVPGIFADAYRKTAQR